MAIAMAKAGRAFARSRVEVVLQGVDRALQLVQRHSRRAQARAPLTAPRGGDGGELSPIGTISPKLRLARARASHARPEEVTMPKLLLSVIVGAVLAAGAASAQTASPNRPPNEKNPEATCPAGAT